MRELHELEEARNIDIRTIDKSKLTDIDAIKINTNLPVQERIKNFMEQTVNPYCQIIDGVVVKYTFSNDSESLSEKLKTYIKGKIE